MRSLHPHLLSALFAPVLAVSATAQAAPTAPEAPLAQSFAELGPDVARYHEHVVTLADPFMDGRLPGTPGMELAKQYCEYWLERAGVNPAFAGDTGDLRWRQPFPLGASLDVGALSLATQGARMLPGDDIQALGLGSGGTATAEMVFAGYGIESGPNGYTSFDESVSLADKVVAIFRFEPMDESGQSKWGDGRWSQASGLSDKIAAVAKQKPAAIILINPPGADDERANQLMSSGSGGTQSAEVPVVHMSHQGAARMLADNGFASTLLELRQHFDEGGRPVATGVEATVAVELERTPLVAENVAGILPGRGDLANEYILIGAHLDHLGLGDFGSRRGAGSLHPGADDNASGSAAILMLADKLKQSYDALPGDTPARSIIFMLFSGEESGLNGSRYYVNNPSVPLENIALMINFDMIGRIKNQRMQIASTDSGVGLHEFTAAIAANSPLEVLLPDGLGGGSDHIPFYNREIPAVMGSLAGADFHDDYHTPDDVVAKINRVDAVHVVNLFHQIALNAAQQAKAWEFQSERNNDSTAGGSTLSEIKVRFGIMPGNYDDTEPGIVVAGVTPEGSADKAGLLEGDRLLRWDGQKITDVQAWMGLMSKHNPGDIVNVGVIRDGEEITLPVTLQAATQRGR